MYSLESGPQLRAARAMAGIDRQRLANAAGVAVQTVRRLEGLDRIRATTTTVESLQRALEAAGVEFLPGEGRASARTASFRPQLAPHHTASRARHDDDNSRGSTGG